MDRVRIFIGSASEGLDVAQNIRAQLKAIAEVTIWHEGVFGLGRGTLETLEALDAYDFAVLVLTSDDVTRSRGKSAPSPRDNVLFECGLFMGRLGRERTFVVFDTDSKIKLPSDFAGVTLAAYKGTRQDDNLLAAVGEACDPIRDAIRRQGPLKRPLASRSKGTAATSTGSTGSPRTIWFLGSLNDVDTAEAHFTRKLLPILASGLAQAAIRIVVGESDDLIAFAKHYRTAVVGANLPAPSPIVLVDKLRQCDLREKFSQNVGVVPDVAVVIGGSVKRGRVAEECESAKAAGIRLLPVAVTGGYARAVGNEGLVRMSTRDRGILNQMPEHADVGDVASTIIRLIS